jgi:hypothetical protein
MTSQRPGSLQRFGSFVLLGAIWIAAALFAVWALGALWYDFPMRPQAAAVAFGSVLLFLLVVMRGCVRKAVAWIGASCAVLVWWLTLQPRGDRDWQPDVAQTAWADIDGDVITLHNVRRCDYRSVSDYTPRWETRTVRLSQVTGIDFAITYWGSPYMAHPIASFQFADAPPLCFSIETRKEVGEKYSAIGGFYRQYELIYVVADETDVIRLRTSVRQREDVYLYRLNVTPEQARGRFMDYITALNQLHERPRWYNAATTNCTTSIRTQHDASKRAPWDWRILVNGKADEMMFERGAFVTGGLSFPELRAAARIDDAAKGAAADETFSRTLRAGRPGLTPSAPSS